MFCATNPANPPVQDIDEGVGDLYKKFGSVDKNSYTLNVH